MKNKFDYLDIDEKEFECESYGNVDDKLDAALISSCVKGNVLACKQLIRCGGNLNAVDKKGWTAFLNACHYSHPEVIKLLIQENADINAPAYNGWNGLLLSCWNGDEDIAELLIAHGADINMKNAENLSPLAICCYLGHDRLANTLLDAGADIIDILQSDSNASVKLARNGNHATKPHDSNDATFEFIKGQLSVILQKRQQRRRQHSLISNGQTSHESEYEELRSITKTDSHITQPFSMMNWVMECGCTAVFNILDDSKYKDGEN